MGERFHDRARPCSGNPVECDEKVQGPPHLAEEPDPVEKIVIMARGQDHRASLGHTIEADRRKAVTLGEQLRTDLQEDVGGVRGAVGGY